MAGKKLQCDRGWFRRVICLMETDPALAVRILGTDKETFVNIRNAAEEREDARKKEPAERPDRERESGGGDKPQPALFQLITALVYLRRHVTTGYLAVRTGCSEGSVWNYIHAMLPAIKDALPAGLLEEWRRASPDLTSEQSEALLAEVADDPLPVDAFEHSRMRPGDDDAQRERYSGKAMRHTRKGRIVSLPDGSDIVDCVFGEKGKTHDGKVFDLNRDRLPDSAEYQGDSVGWPGVTAPYRKPRSGELAEARKEFCRALGKRRIKVEHVIRRLRIFRIAKEVFRMDGKMYQIVMECVAGPARARMRQAKCACRQSAGGILA